LAKLQDAGRLPHLHTHTTSCVLTVTPHHLSRLAEAAMHVKTYEWMWSSVPPDFSCF